MDAVFLKSNGEDELVVLNPEKVDRNILIERYKLANQQKQALTAKLEDLKARHQNLTGDVKTWYLRKILARLKILITGGLLPIKLRKLQIKNYLTQI